MDLNLPDQMRASDDAAMHSQTAFSHSVPPTSVPAAPIRSPDAFQRVIDSGLLRCAVPPELGGLGGPISALHDGALRLAADCPAAAWVLWAQRLAIEALVQSRNAGLRDFILPDLLAGERAGTLPLSLGGNPVQAIDTGRGWRLHGRLVCASNWQWVGHSVAVPVQFGADPAGVAWVWLRGEEDGLDIAPLTDADALPGSQTAELTLRGVYFREDEWLAGAELAALITPIDQALRPALHDR